MKTFKEFLSEEITRADIETDAEKEAERLGDALKKLLGKQYVVQSIRSKNLGKSLHLRVHDIAPVNNIAHNSPVFMQFILHLSGSFGQQVDLDKVSWEMSVGPRSIPYRKISSKKSIADANDKLIAWFKKNKKELDRLLK
jgi:hypothetical protein